MPHGPDGSARQAGPWTDLDRPPLRTAALRSALVRPTGPLGGLDVLTQTPSTQTVLAGRVRAELAGGSPVPDLAVVTTDHQSAGRGRLDRTFTTPPRAALATSVLLRTPPSARGRLSWLPLLAGLSVVTVLRRLAGVPAVLKWPNDVLVPDASSPGPGTASPGKVCGVLAEVVRPATAAEGPLVVLGVGLNVTQSRAELPGPGATSLRLLGAATTDRDTLLRAWLREWAHVYRRWGDGSAGPAGVADLAAAVQEVCSTLGEDVRVELPGGAVLEGLAEELDDTGALRVRGRDGQVRTVTSGDVVHVRTT